jgi:hypothetical protein
MSTVTGALCAAFAWIRGYEQTVAHQSRILANLITVAALAFVYGGHTRATSPQLCPLATGNTRMTRLRV